MFLTFKKPYLVKKNAKMEKYTTSKRPNYLSFSDKAQDLTKESLISILKTAKKLSRQMVIMKELENRNVLSDDEYFALLENCNGI